jgi:hypothetical protein
VNNISFALYVVSAFHFCRRFFRLLGSVPPSCAGISSMLSVWMSESTFFSRHVLLFTIAWIAYIFPLIFLKILFFRGRFGERVIYNRSGWFIVLALKYKDFSKEKTGILPVLKSEAFIRDKQRGQKCKTKTKTKALEIS